MTESDATALNFNELVGLTVSEASTDRAVVKLTLGAQHLQSYGIPHGGVYCVLHEVAASLAGVTWVNRDRAVDDPQIPVVGANNTVDFLRQAKVGDTITTTATPIHRGRMQQLWRVESADQDGRLIAQGQLRLANLST
ncbi:MAG TPA: PaaI family thioesterase [Aeromicrobium sp.]|nr:PaaI family thioesterase [Aeromicrobium sp.]